jgi:hypothetical protein
MRERLLFLLQFLFSGKLPDGSNIACLNSLAPSSPFCCISDILALC